MRRKKEFDFEDEPSGLVNIVIIVAAVIVLAAVIVGAYFLLFRPGDGSDPSGILGEEIVSGSGEESGAENADGSGNGAGSSTDGTGDNGESGASGETTAADDPAQDPQSEDNMVNTETGAETDVTRLLTGEGAVETSEETVGIDVSRYQGTIDWAKVAASGIDFAMVRVGYRTTKTGEIVEDTTAKYNLQEATANGIKVGAYFFSTAVSEAEAVEEAEWTREFISGYKITYPVAYNCEGYENRESRQYGLTKEERSGFAKAFLNEIYEGGYTPMFYASKGEMESDSKWMTSELEKSYKIWVSWYPAAAYPQTAAADYTGAHAMWQYTNNGTVDGISQPVDVNVAYFGYESEADAQGDRVPERVEADVEALMNFQEVQETVTAKEATNLRNIPSQGEDSTVMLTLYNGQTATRTAISPSGWSRVVYNGEIYYAVSSYLTTDLTAKTPEPAPEPEDDGIETEFTEVNEKVTPKIEVNLRTLPSVTHPDSAVAVTLKYGEVVTRTGINTDLGWSRVEYNGQTLYCVSSYVFVTE